MVVCAKVLRVFPKPVIAAVEGAAAGGGFSLALACDLIVAADDAKFIMSYGRIGLSPDGGASWQLMQRLPRSLVLQLLWLSEPITTQQLQVHGIVNWVTAKGQALTQALEVADRVIMGLHVWVETGCFTLTEDLQDTRLFEGSKGVVDRRKTHRGHGWEQAVVDLLRGRVGWIIGKRAHNSHSLWRQTKVCLTKCLHCPFDIGRAKTWLCGLSSYHR